MLRKLLILALCASLTGCATWSDLSTGQKALVVLGAAGAIYAVSDDSSGRSDDPSDCFAPCPGRCVRPIVCN